MSALDKSGIIILVCAVFLSLFLVYEDRMDDGLQDNVGFAAHPLYEGFSTMTDTFDLYSDLIYGSADPYKTLRFSLSDSLVYKTAYISVDGGTWQPVTLTGTTPVYSWFSGSVSGAIDIPTNLVSGGVTSNNYIAVYSCSRNGTTWDCNDNQWQITTFTTLKAEPTYSMPYIACVTADNYDATNNALPAYTIDNNLSDASRWSGYGDGAWLKYDFLNDMFLTGVDMMFYKGNSRVARFSLEYSTTGNSWVKIGDYSSSGTSTGFESFRFSPITARYFRVVGHGNTEAAMADWTSIIELKFTNSTSNVVTCNPSCSVNAYTSSNTCSPSGTCQPTCVSGHGNCDGNNANGCETNLLTSTGNCGSCGRSCTGTCSNGQCTTATPQTSTTGKIYYLSPTGSDQNGNGSVTNPWFTLNKAWSVIQAGDTVYMRGGTYRYRQQQILRNKNGNSTGYIKIFAFGDEKPVITRDTTFADPSWPTELVVIGGRYIHVKGLDISGNIQQSVAIWGAIRAYFCEDCVFELLDIHDNGGGMQLTNTNNCLVLNSDFHHNQDPLTTSAGAYGNADGLGIDWLEASALGITDATKVNEYNQQSRNAVNHIQNCRFWYNTDDGLDAWEYEGMLYVNNSWAWYNGFIPYTFQKAGDGSGFKLGRTTDAMPNTVLRKITNCVSFYNKKWGFLDNSAQCNMELYNNIAYKNCYQGYDSSWCGGFHFNLVKNVPYYIRNNIAYNPGGTNAVIATLTNVDHNSWDTSGISVSDADFSNIVPDGMDGARKADGSLPDITFLHLAAGSDLIDKGVSVPGRTVDADGKSIVGAPDLGPFETG